MKFCSNCGKELADDASVCTNCGTTRNTSHAPQTPPPQQQQAYQQPQQTYQQPQQTYQQPQQTYQQPQQTYQGNQSPAKDSTGECKSIPAFIIGLIGSILALFGGMCVAACASFSGLDGKALFFLVGGSIVGMVGACMCFKKANIGSLLMIGGAIMIAICAFTITGADFMTLAGMIMLAIGGVVGLLTSKKS
ncbi:MAG: zinc ribbon domain-containing protein [Clostridia bacterium]|nr:zinc ribbon domain-containing protein [Clostridia bacterium]